MVRVASTLQSVLSLSTNLTELFGPSLSSDAKIILPEQKSWSIEIQERWTDYQAPSYLGAIIPATVQDVQRIVSQNALHAS